MTLTAVGHRRWALLVALVAVFSVFIASPAVAEPDDEGGNTTLRQKLDAAARGYIEAKARYDNSKRTEIAMGEQMRTAELRLALLSEQVGAVAAQSYRTGRLGVMTALLSSGSPDMFLARAASVEMLALQENARLAELNRLRRELAQHRDRLNSELQLQAQQMAEMEKRKKDAERALGTAGRPLGGFVSGNSPAAKPAPRNSDGSWPRESCTVDDPSTGGCLTPRTYHAYQQTKAAGFNHYVSCYRSGGGGEHPLGRACDWAAAKGTFGGAATGADRTYGDNLAMWYVKNADRLGVLYVIWYRQIWLPGSGWRAYSGRGSPSAEHTNHVHLSVY